MQNIKKLIFIVYKLYYKITVKIGKKENHVEKKQKIIIIPLSRQMNCEKNLLKTKRFNHTTVKFGTRFLYLDINCVCACTFFNSTF